MSLRVVAGSAGGLRLFAPPGNATRPTANRAREAVFNSLYSLGAIAGARVLDLYAGSGALGIEALSRGAEHVTFVERHRNALKALRANLRTTRLQERSEIMAIDVKKALDDLNQRAARFDLALIDPPYSFDRWPQLLARTPAELYVIESNRRIELGPDLRFHNRQRHGGTVVTFAFAADSGA